MFGLTKVFNFSASGSLRLVSHFVRHVLIGTFLFVILGLAAIALKGFNDLLLKVKMPEEITDITHYLELFIFAADVISYVIFVVAETYALIREIIKDQYKSTKSIAKIANLANLDQQQNVP